MGFFLHLLPTDLFATFFFFFFISFSQSLIVLSLLSISSNICSSNFSLYFTQSTLFVFHFSLHPLFTTFFCCLVFPHVIPINMWSDISTCSFFQIPQPKFSILSFIII